MKWWWMLRLWLARQGLWLPGKVMYIGGSDVLPAPLSREEEGLCIARLEAGEEGAANRLIEHNLRLVVYIARRFENTGVGLEDLISIGTIGLIKAVGTYKPSKNIKLATYASRCIENEILMHLRRNNKLKAEVSLEEPLKVDWDGNELLLSDVLSSDADIVYREMDNESDRVALHRALNKLNNRERRIMDLRFGFGGGGERTQKEVADMLGISQSYISRIEKKIMNRLRKELIQEDI
jgi:RNA polymerase sporulation-specific sigma factor